MLCFQYSKFGNRTVSTNFQLPELRKFAAFFCCVLMSVMKNWGSDGRVKGGGARKPALLSAIQCQEKRQQTQTREQEVSSKHQKALLCSVDDKALMQVAQWVETFRAAWMWCWATSCRCPCLISVWTSWLPEIPYNPNHPVILWTKRMLLRRWNKSFHMAGGWEMGIINWNREAYDLT